MQAIIHVKDASPFNVPATFNRQAAKTVNARVIRSILLYVVILSSPDSRLWLTCLASFDALPVPFGLR